MRQAFLRCEHASVVFNQQAEAAAMEGAEHWTRCKARSSSSLKEPLAGASQHEHEPAT